MQTRQRFPSTKGGWQEAWRSPHIKPQLWCYSTRKGSLTVSGTRRRTLTRNSPLTTNTTTGTTSPGLK
ncbi:hypothetical protein DPMN_104237 [Dreissena polymorpha]|uniref:Uncharacterized protein n=1 Tax=Dreissena polymorpha TaxID=45954 RepID=A0A9D4H9D9_DREPO|nr:hypothetical protein DPMN_104237 [Dreissena polymorpha]